MKEKIDDYLQDFYTVDQNYNTITMMKEKKNMVVTYRKDNTDISLIRPKRRFQMVSFLLRFGDRPFHSLS